MNIDAIMRFNSEAQRSVFNQILSGDHRTLLVRGGAGSGKTYINHIGILIRALTHPETEHYNVKTDYKVMKKSFEGSVIRWLKDAGLSEAKSKKRNRTYFYDEQKGSLYLGNGSCIFMRPIRSPRPYGTTGDSDLLGINAETIHVDESTTILYDWYSFFETRCRSARGCPPLLLLSENPDARCWTHNYFDKGIDPKTLKELSPIQRNSSKVMRIESYENAMQDEHYLEILKNSGNAQRFYYGIVDDRSDYGRIYQYSVSPMTMRFANIYALDIGYKARTAIVQIGFGGDYTVNIRELCYKQGLLRDDILEEVQKVIDLHSDYFAKIKQALSPGQWDKLLNYHALPYLVVDQARPDVAEEIVKHFNYSINELGIKVKDPKIVVLLSRKGENKYYSVERVKKLKQIVDPNSRHYIKEISEYRYKGTLDDDNEVIPDGNDDALDAALYGMRHILEDVFNPTPRLLVFDPTYQQIYDRIKNIPI